MLCCGKDAFVRLDGRNNGRSFMFKTIVVGTDGSSNAEKAVRAAAAIASAGFATIRDTWR